MYHRLLVVDLLRCQPTAFPIKHHFSLFEYVVERTDESERTPVYFDFRYICHSTPPPDAFGVNVTISISVASTSCDAGDAKVASSPLKQNRTSHASRIVTYLYIYRWYRQGRKSQRCAVTARAKVMNSIRVEFQDGYIMITSGNAIRRARP